MKLPPPTDEVRRLVHLIGPEATLALVEAKGGMLLYIPARPLPWLSNLVGEQAAASLIDAHAGEHIKVPVARQWRILVYFSRGLSNGEIAHKVGCSINTVRRTNQRERPSAQLRLL